MTQTEQRWFDGGFQVGLKMCELIATGHQISTYPVINDLTDLELTITALDAQIKERTDNGHNLLPVWQNV